MTDNSNPDPAGPSASADADLMYLRVSRLVFGQPLLLSPDVAETIGSFLRSRMEGARPEASRFAGRNAVDPQSGAWKGYRKTGSVAVISIMGELVNRGAWLGASSGLTSYEGIVQQVRAAVEDADVSTILYDINSPGGEAYGMADAARTMRALAAGKRTIAVINAIGTSAAYGVATSADEIVITESGVAGSIGVVRLHLDRSEQAAKMGVKATVITNSDGTDKAIGNPYKPLSDEDVASLRADADRIMDGFVALVTDHRPGLDDAAVRAQRARIFIGADAVAAGLADRVGTFESVLAEVQAGNSRAPASGRSTSMKGKAMEATTGAPAADAGISREEHEKAVAAAERKGFDAATSRLATVLCADGVKGDPGRIAAALDLAVKNPAMSSADVTAFVTAHVAPAPTSSAASADAVLSKMDKAAEGVTSTASTAGTAAEQPAAAATTPEGWKAEWEASSALKAEYPTADAYVAVKKREAQRAA